jgi:hypothetical protein
MPTTHMATPWRLRSVSGTAINFPFDVPGEITWQYPEEARVAYDPCGGSPTVLSTPAAVPLRRIRVPVRLNKGSDRNTRITALKALWVGRGPYLLDTPSGTLTVVIDPSQGALEEQWRNGARIFLIGFAEVTS